MRLHRLVGWIGDVARTPARNRANLDTLERHGLTSADRRYFEACVRMGVRTPDDLTDRLMRAAARARDAGERLA
jgi:hypothetical protein